MVRISQKSGDGLVFSTEFGKMCPRCNQSVKKCNCQKNRPDSKNQSGSKNRAIKNDGIVRLMRETKGRKGKGVTLVTGLDLESGELKKMAKSLKQKCGSGGSLKNGVIEIQGDHRDMLENELKGLGYKVKRSGG
jgi:translation initiation factor 1